MSRLQTSRLNYRAQQQHRLNHAADESRKEEIERAKQEQLRDQKQGRNEWKQELGSESESVVKADRGELNASKETISELQKESAKAAQREKDGK
ncbi:hypothetical protein PRZ48_014503 [Zasmidium cellare]|uniref:Uncharacterized protein n=1 Tax=Zasmidium cellare TaxID=395010 RepID=A0ABR0DYF2_ZASCE|nr:hypothetical protein PRZ48_014503 [Zasmidium cellare]